MASSSSSSPISSIAQDHLYSILMLLPTSSIISFSMTSKRFRTVATCDYLWEYICNRDWGLLPMCLNDFNRSTTCSSSTNLCWMKVFKHVSLMDLLSCQRLINYTDPHQPTPTPRASHSLNFVSDSLVLFAGGSEGGRHLDDTWVAYMGGDLRRILKWQKTNTGIPSGRFGHTCVVIGDSLVVFGGINDNGIRQNDTWIGQVSHHDTHGVTLSWRLFEIGPNAPAPRGAHAGCCVNNRTMVIHGGIGLFGLRLGDTWVLEMSENLRFGTWREIVTYPSPPARSGHTLTCIGGARSVVFGGRGAGYDVLSDVWVFDISEENGKWIQVAYEAGNIGGGVSLARVGHSATVVFGGKILIYGGEDSLRHRKDDFWVLDYSNVMDKVKGGKKIWKKLKWEGYKPECRSFHRACSDRSGRYVYVFGGMVDGLLHQPEPSGLRFDGDVFLVELVLNL